MVFVLHHRLDARGVFRPGKLLPVILRAHRLGIEKVDLRRTAHLEERDHRLRLGLEVRRFRQEIVAHRPIDVRLDRGGEQTILPKP